MPQMYPMKWFMFNFFTFFMLNFLPETYNSKVTTSSSHDIAMYVKAMKWQW